jgi:hypothetical protein
MALREMIKKKLRAVLDQLSGEYSAGSKETATPPPESRPTTSGEEVKVTRARLRRPPGEPEA